MSRIARFAPVWAVFFGCSTGSEDAVSQALAPVAGAGAEALQACQEIAFEDLSIPCFVQVAAQAAGEGDDDLARAACKALPLGTWSEECHFRAGEEWGRRGALKESLSHCLEAGRFARFCLTHVAWNLPPTSDVTSDTPAAEGASKLVAEGQRVEALLSGAVDGLEGEGRDIFRSRLWFNAYFGTGHSSPALALAAPDALGPAARGAWALEAARLRFPPGEELPADAVQILLQAWSAGLRFDGQVLEPDKRVGRYMPPVPSPYEADVPKIPVYGGGFRAVGHDVEEDLVLAILEALFFLSETPGELFAGWLTDERERVRWTAARLMSGAVAKGEDRLVKLAAVRSHADPAVRWHAEFIPTPGRSKTEGGSHER